MLRVAVPALRDRADDIPVLVEHFMARSRERSPQSVLVGVEPDALDFLAGLEWPGNVRQLENLVERLVVTASAPLARVADVKQALGTAPGADPIPRLAQNPLKLDELVERYIAAVLKSGRRQQAEGGADPGCRSVHAVPPREALLLIFLRPGLSSRAWSWRNGTS